MQQSRRARSDAHSILAMSDKTGARVWLASRRVLERVGCVLAEAARQPRAFEVEAFACAPDESQLAGDGGGEEVGAQRPKTMGGQAENECALMPFTSGTTLAPKGVPLTHANFLANLRAIRQVVSIGRSDEFLSVLPLYHVLGFTAGLLAPLSAGATVTYVDRVTPAALLEAMQATRTTVMIGVPRLYALLARRISQTVESASPARRGVYVLLLGAARVCRGLEGALGLLAPAARRLRAVLFRRAHRRFGGRIRFLVSGGAALPPDVFDSLDLLGLTVCEGYGLTETSPVLTLNPPARPRRGTAGPPLPGVELRIDHPDGDGVGDIMVRGPCVFSGYCNDEESTGRAFRDGWFRTGDRGRLERDGYLTLAGRADDVIVTGAGKNVYPDEIEWLYRELPHVKEFCVVGVPDPGSAGHAVHAVVVLDDSEGGPSVGARRGAVESAASRIARELRGHQRVRRFHFWDGELPRTYTLKVKRQQVREAVLAALSGEENCLG